jgi:hypothetical protein
MDKTQAIYVADLIEAMLRAMPGTPMANARDEFMLSHGTYGLVQLGEAEQALRTQWQIPDSTGKVNVDA